MSRNLDLAATAEAILAAGPMSYDQRRPEHEEFLERTFGNGRALLFNIHTGPGTECAVFVGACAIAAGVVPRHGWPKIPAITTWTGLGGFVPPAWIPFAATLQIQRGDVFYWCGGGPNTWQQATNGHVGIARDGDGFLWSTAEGGGGADGTTCRLSAAPKDVRSHSARPLRGIWRPNLLGDAHQVPTPLTLRKGSRGEDVKRLQELLAISADGVFGAQTEGAVRSFQIANGLTADGVVGPKTWAALKVTHV